MVDHTVERRMMELIEAYPDVMDRVGGDGVYLQMCDTLKEFANSAKLWRTSPTLQKTLLYHMECNASIVRRTDR